MRLSLEDFKRKVQVLDDGEATELRAKFIGSLIDKTSQYFVQRIANAEPYSGYLWDCFKNKREITCSALVSELTKHSKVFVMWDVHSEQKIFIKDYWKFEKKDVLYVNVLDLIDNLEYLPEDIYIFDSSLSWSLVFTHEDIDGERYCLKAQL